MLTKIDRLYSEFFCRTNLTPNILLLDNESHCQFMIELRELFPKVKIRPVKYHQMLIYQIKGRREVIKVAYEEKV